MAETYKIVRFYAKSEKCTIKTGLSLAEARKHCIDPETSSRSATSASALAVTRHHGDWFDGYEREQIGG